MNDKEKKLIELLGLKDVKQAGSQFRCICPFHKETNASLFITVDGSLYHCFGCLISGRLSKLLVLLLGITHTQAKNKLKDLGIEEDRAVRKEKHFAEVLSESCLKIYKDSPELYSYVCSRGFYGETVRYFGLKYDPWSKAVVFPIRDINNKLVALGYRSIYGKDFWFFPKGFKKTLWGIEKVKNWDTAYIVEGFFDRMALYEHGIEPSLALMANAYNKTQAKDLVRFKELILMLDNDRGGREGIRKFAKLHKKLLINVIKLPAKDPATIGCFSDSDKLKKISILEWSLRYDIPTKDRV